MDEKKKGAVSPADAVNRKGLLNILTRRLKADQVASIMDLLEPLFLQAETGIFAFCPPNSEQEPYVQKAIENLTGYGSEVLLWASPEEIRKKLAEGRLDDPSWVPEEAIFADRKLVRDFLGYVPDEQKPDPVMAELEECLQIELYAGLLLSICAALEPPTKKETAPKAEAPIGDWLAKNRPQPPKPPPEPKSGLQLNPTQCPSFWRGLETNLTNAIFFTVMSRITGQDAPYDWQSMVQVVSQGLLPLKTNEETWLIIRDDKKAN